MSKNDSDLLDAIYSANDPLQSLYSCIELWGWMELSVVNENCKSLLDFGFCFESGGDCVLQWVWSAAVFAEVVSSFSFNLNFW